LVIGHVDGIALIAPVLPKLAGNHNGMSPRGFEAGPILPLIVLDPCHICYVTAKSPHPYYLKIKPCNGDVDRHRWEIFDDEGLLQRSADSFATEREAKDNGHLEMQGLVEMWNKK
jgi:hypothetical protein